MTSEEDVLDSSSSPILAPSTRSSDGIGISDMPEEILIRIIDYLEFSNRSERERIIHEKWHLVNKIANDKISSYWSYEPPSEPTLNPLQSMGSLDKKFYRICRPVLWKHLVFPSPLPSTITRWTENLLPKHGEFVRSITVALGNSSRMNSMVESRIRNRGNLKLLKGQSKDSNSTLSHLPFFLENMIVQSKSSSGRPSPTTRQNGINRGSKLSFECLNEILTYCPKVQGLSLDVGLYGTPQQISIVRTRTLELISNVIGLRKLKITCNISTPDTYLVKILQQAPLLEVLNCLLTSRTSENINKDGVNKLAIEIVAHKKLSSLIIWDSILFDNSWGIGSGPSKLTELKISYCDFFLDDKKLFSIINHFAPNLIKLHIGYHKTKGSSKKIENYEPKNDTFELTKLQDLILHDPTDFDLIKSFKSCKNIHRICYRRNTKYQWNVISELVCNFTWPNLKKLELLFSRHYSNPETRLSSKLCSFCADSSIELISEPD
ncbi:hypothetical protein CROQUDRAFT_86282 [Cronartium quercuum f. sp. fusiforme G11]|uniref:F-box domain-containing protein n=1 Tax=Cronartium quercuum f. sp. fusiforme G11 TaxID=708437 RepID=A0A9P6NWK6_9BASI|nr:hypothetical protein CROQUDRAFT_86282 [Cronartium quercuum f. sp. fusiforme G11]